MCVLVMSSEITWLRVEIILAFQLTVDKGVDMPKFKRCYKNAVHWLFHVCLLNQAEPLREEI